jgi:6-phosphogluconolactonase
MIRSLFRLALLAQVLALPLTATPAWVYFGNAGMEPNSAIYASSFDPDTGALGEPVAAAPAWNPVWLDADPKHHFLYAITGKSGPHKLPLARLQAFRIDSRSGDLALISDLSPGSPEACHALVSPDGRSLLLANYLDGSVDVYALNGDGTLGPRTAHQRHSGTGPMSSRQEGPHAHSVNLDPTGRYLVSNDLGADKIYVYRFNHSNGTLVPAATAFVATAPGSGPRHFAFLPSGNFAYAITELTSTLIAFRWDAERGALQPLQTLSLVAPDYKGKNLSAEVAVDRASRHLYASNRGEDTLVVYAIDQSTGSLTFVQRIHDGINLPRTFAIDPSGRWLIAANTGADNVGLYRIEAGTGRLAPTGIVRKVPKPLCVVFVPGQ